jgi:hypothetical protein
MAPFDQGSSWIYFDMGTLDSGATGFAGMVFDGRYLYFVPNVVAAQPSGLAARYDTTMPIGATGSWAFFDVSMMKDTRAKGFVGGVFDGRYVYFVPDDDGVGDGVVARYDTTAPFQMSSSWSTFDVQSVATGAVGFYAGAFDGRYVYLGGRVVARYDTMASFGMVASWTTFDTADVNGGIDSLFGAAFDGEYLYWAPGASGIAARFHAKQPASIPPSVYGGSFY